MEALIERGNVTRNRVARAFDVADTLIREVLDVALDRFELLAPRVELLCGNHSAVPTR